MKSNRNPTTYKILDIQALEASEPESAVKDIEIERPDKVVKCDLLIAGGGMGAIAAVLSSLLDYFVENGNKRPQKLSICLTEETNWLGGQMTSQGVSALDENRLVETSGASAVYQKLRSEIRDYYLNRFIINRNTATDNRYFNPGNCWVSRLSFEPKVGLAILDKFLKPAVDSGCLKIFHRHKAIDATTSRSPDGRIRIKSVLMVDLDSEKSVEFRPTLCIDATEFGDLLPICGLKYCSGEDSGAETEEPHAAETADPE
ncbi:MAG: FAD-dependent oxidoreductase, partial [Candidatus Obscuribacterales bacterium]|nr:FAD-dependent oxidoreductase [Candidatus Obscuribacterales bacterium]